MTTPVFEKPVRGLCLLCGADKVSVVRARLQVEGIPHVAVCDLCAHALRHHWQRALGERVSATSPAVARTYVLVPRLPKDREELDVSSYEVLVGLDGRLPSVPFARDAGALCASLAQRFGLATWPETLRKFYVGYDGSGDFAEVYLAWAWGQVVGPHTTESSRAWTTFGDLLGEATPEAGFVLGVKAAFESSVLWHREHAPEDNRVFVRLREPAMRCLRYLTAEDPEVLGEDEAMLDLCKQAVTPEERAVLDLVEASRSKVAEEAALEAEAEAGGVDTDTGNDAGASDEDVDGTAEEEQPPLPGFARAGGLKRDE